MIPLDLDEELSRIRLGTMYSPGVVKLSRHDRVKNWDTQKAKGQTGATDKLNGDDPGEFDALFMLAGGDGDNPDGPTDFDMWEDFQRLCESTVNGPKPVALPIYHPDLVRNHFTEVVLKKMGGMVHDGQGGATVTVTFKEYKPAKPKKSSKATPKPGGDTIGGQFGPPPPDPNAAAKAELAALVAEAQRPL